MSRAFDFMRWQFRCYLLTVTVTIIVLAFSPGQLRAQTLETGKVGFATVPENRSASSEPAYSSVIPKLAGMTDQQQAQCFGAGGVKASVHAQTGKLSFLGKEPWNPVLRSSYDPGAAGVALPETAARAYLAACGPLFGVNDPVAELVLVRQGTSEDGQSTVRFQQRYKGIPVVGGELIGNLDKSGNVISVNGEMLPDLSLDIVPTVAAVAARENALQAVAKKYGIDVSSLIASQPELWIYNPTLIEPVYGTSSAALVWRLEIKPVALGPIRELVLVDARRGSIRLSFNQVDGAKNRLTYTANNGQNLPGTLVASESNPTCAGCEAHALFAHRNAGLTYDFYFDYLGRDSLNNGGVSIVSTVHYGNGYANAFWNGDQMVYGDASSFPAATDVVAHELTHGVTQYTANLFYWFQSGAINESLSDLFGEFVDQLYGSGNLSKWLIGQDVQPGGPFRDMRNPPAFGDPDKMTSPLYYTGLSDNGGVHTNSGVNNKAVYLMTEGGKFNGRTVQGIGIAKVAKIYYRAQTTLLTSGSDYGDLYNALYQGCLSLVGTSGIVVADCQVVRAATDAVEMNLQPVTNYNPEAPVCTSGQVPSNIFFDDFESGLGKWSTQVLAGQNRWSSVIGFAHSGLSSLYGNDYPPEVTDSTIKMLNTVLLPANAYLHFSHAFDFEANHDGGVVEYSTDNGVTWTDVGGLIDYNGYTGAVYVGDGNPLAGRSAFVYDSHGYISTRATLASLAGTNVRFRWRLGLDNSGYSLGWFVDDVRIYTCSAAPAAPPVTTLISPSSAGGDVIRTSTPTFTWNAVSTATQYSLYIVGSSDLQYFYAAADVGCATGIGICSKVSPVNLPAGSYRWWVDAYNPKGWGPWSSPLSFTVSLGPPEATPVNPSGVVTTSTPTYEWNPAATAEWYYLWVTDLSGPTHVITQWYTAAEAGCPGGITRCSIRPSTALSSGRYKWWIQTWNASGYGPWSIEQPFSVVVAAPQTPTLVSPTGSVATSTPTYTWNAVAGATMYYLWVDGPLSTMFQKWYMAGEVGCGSGAGTCAATPSPLFLSGPYRWWVQAWNPAGYSPWSAPLSFVMNAPPPAAWAVAPTGQVASRTPTYVWVAVPTATWYGLWVSGPSGQVLLNWYTSADASCPNGIGLCMVTPAAQLVAGASYRFQVQTWNPGGYGPWSLDSFFTVGTGGFDSQFNGDAADWTAQSGSWFVDSSRYLSTTGISSKWSSVSHTKEFADLDYQAMFWRQGCTTCSNNILIRGNPTPLRADNAWDSTYLFQYTADGSFSIWKLVTGNPGAIPLQFWAPTPAINKGEAWNLLRVVAHGGYLYFYINNSLVWSGYDTSMAYGQAGISMYSDVSPLNQLWVDWATLASTAPLSIVGSISPAQQALNAEANLNPKGTMERAPETIKIPVP